ncbi:MAG: tyrosine-type recombinase/integrase [Rickettsiales bacterium]|nr:tyrosine-type recombinase/integrase [Rickettsiales bacterium]
MPLTDIKVKSAKPQEKQYKLSDDGGLYLLIHPNGSKYWRLKYRISGKEKVYAIGAYPEITLLEAREERQKLKKLIKQNIDPVEQKKEQKLKSETNPENTFEYIAHEWHELQKPTWTSKHAKNVLKRLGADVFPYIGNKAVSSITAQELLTLIRKIEERGAIDIAHRACQTCGQIFRYAISIGKAERDISADLRGALKTRKKVHHAYLTEKDLPEFMQKLKDYKGDIITPIAIQLLILTFVRTSELINAKWEEFNFDKKEWHIPPERMKMREKHIVPLSEQVLNLLNELKNITGLRPFLFPSQNSPHKTMSNNTILYALYRMGYHSRATGHGFRATASTILNEHGFKYDVIERQLAHGERNKVRASYNHAQYLKERREMMDWWGEFIEKLGG